MYLYEFSKHQRAVPCHSDYWTPDEGRFPSSIELKIEIITVTSYETGF